MLRYYFTYKLVYVTFWINIPLYIFKLCLGELLDIFHLSSLRSWHFLWTCCYHILSVSLHLYQSSKRTMFVFVTFSYSYRKIRHIHSVSKYLWPKYLCFTENLCVFLHFFPLTLNYIAKIREKKRYIVWECFGSSHYLQKHTSSDRSFISPS